MKKDTRCLKISKKLENENNVKIIVTHTKTSNEFYGIDHRMISDIRKLENEMNTWYSDKQHTFEFPYIPSVGTICAALVRNKWYRAKIMYHENSMFNGGCGVFLIDSGEEAHLKSPCLHWLEDRFFWVPHSVSRFTLLGSALIGEVPGVPEQKDINECKDTGKQKTVLVYIDHSFGSFPRSYAITLSPQILDKKEVCDIENATDIKNISQNVNTIDRNLERYPTEVQKRIVKMSLCISPSEFYLQFESERGSLMRLQNELQTLNTIAPYEPKQHWKVGEKCYVRTQKTDTLRECWYRGKIVETTHESWKVFLRDYGNVFRVRASENLISVNEKLETMQNAAIKCSLAFIAPPNESGWSSTCIDKFHDLYQKYDRLAVTLLQNQSHSDSMSVILWGLKSVNVSALKPTTCEWTVINKEMVLQGMAKITETTLQLDIIEEKRLILPKEDASINDVLCPKFTSWIAPNPISQSSFLCVPTYVSDELVIYFHDAEEEKMLESMRKASNEKFSKYKNNENIKWSENDACMAKYSDGAYYRAIVLSTTDKTAKVI